jgi:hypothetical protein
LAVEGGKVCIHVKYSILLYPMWIVFCTCKTVCSTAKRNFHGGQSPTEYMICNVLLWCRGVSQTPLWHCLILPKHLKSVLFTGMYLGIRY